MDPDLPLLEAVREGNEAAFRELMDRHRKAIFRFAWRYVRNEAEAADIAEETFVKVFFKASSFNPQAKVSTWIYTIAANLCRDHQRKTARRKTFSLFFRGRSDDGQESSEFVESLADPSQATDQTVLDRENETLIAEEINRLPAKVKASFILFVLEERSQQECAEILGISPKAVETRVYRARKILREVLDEHFH